MKKVLLISLKELYAKRILNGTKTIELRKSTPNVRPGDTVILYTTTPIKSIVGRATVTKVFSDTPENLWKNHQSDLGIEKDAYDQYFKNSKKAVGIVLDNVKSLDNSISLKEIKNFIPSFNPPQTFRYFSFQTIRSFLFFQNTQNMIEN